MDQYRHLRRPALAVAGAAAALALAGTAEAAPPQVAPSGKGPAPAAAATAGSQHLRNVELTGAECPNGLACLVAPAAYQQNSADASDYGNYDLANRPADGLAFRFVVGPQVGLAFSHWVTCRLVSRLTGS